MWQKRKKGSGKNSIINPKNLKFLELIKLTHKKEEKLSGIKKLLH
jgi:hypothetical protein